MAKQRQPLTYPLRCSYRQIIHVSSFLKLLSSTNTHALKVMKIRHFVMAVYTTVFKTWLILLSVSNFNWLLCSTAVGAHNFTYFMRCLCSLYTHSPVPKEERVHLRSYSMSSRVSLVIILWEKNRTTAAELNNSWFRHLHRPLTPKLLFTMLTHFHSNIVEWSHKNEG